MTDEDTERADGDDVDRADSDSTSRGDDGPGRELPWREGSGMPDSVSEAAEGPTDARVHPEQSPGLHSDVEALSDIEVDRDVTIGEADPAELAASDTEPLDDASTVRKLAALADGDAVERRRAALALAEGGGSTTDGGAPGHSTADDDARQRVVDALARAALTDDDSDVRQFAVEALAKIAGDGATGRGDGSDGSDAPGEVALAATRDDDPWVRAEAVVALDRIDRERYADRMQTAVEDDHHAVRRNAAISLFKSRGVDAADLLVDLADDPSERVREWAAHLLAGIPGDRAERTLRRLADDDGEAHVVRSTAARSLEADPGAFRRQFSGALAETTTDRPGEGRLNRQPDL